MKEIVVIGLNPALQKTLVMDSVTMGSVNRAAVEYVSPGGKAIHFARAAHTVFPGSVTPAYFVGGASGKTVIETLTALGINSLTVTVEAETRTCTTVLDQSTLQTTEFVGVSGPVSSGDAGRMKTRLLEQLPSVDGLAFCGTYPEGIDETLFLDVLEHFGGKPVLVDASRGIGRILQSGRVSFLKINLGEARELTGLRDPREIADYCLKEFDLSAMMMTDGPAPAYLMEPGKYLQFDLECITFVNPIGAGDTCAGVMFSSFLNGDDLEHAFSKGLAAASASCMHYEGAAFTLDEMGRLAAGITVRKI